MAGELALVRETRAGGDLCQGEVAAASEEPLRPLDAAVSNGRILRRSRGPIGSPRPGSSCCIKYLPHEWAQAEFHYTDRSGSTQVLRNGGFNPAPLSEIPCRPLSHRDPEGSRRLAHSDRADPPAGTTEARAMPPARRSRSIAPSGSLVSQMW
jgi:hypothetical protein